jgi:hypothetical protein
VRSCDMEGSIGKIITRDVNGIILISSRSTRDAGHDSCSCGYNLVVGVLLPLTMIDETPHPSSDTPFTHCWHAEMVEDEPLLANCNGVNQPPGTEVDNCCPLGLAPIQNYKKT